MGTSDVTINRELAFLRNLYPMAITWGKAAENPVRKGRFARVDNGRIRILTPEEESRLLAHCGPQLKPIVLTALHTGLRKSELLSLTWADVDYRRNSITVQAVYAKNGESRSVPMNEVVAATLKAIRMHAAVDGLVFCSCNGTPYRSFRSAFETAVQKARLADFRFHDSRHTFASRLVMAGAPLPTVQALMGHKTITMTLRYTYLSTDHKLHAVRLLEQFGDKVPAISTTGTQTHSGERLQAVETSKHSRSAGG